MKLLKLLLINWWTKALYPCKVKSKLYNIGDILNMKKVLTTLLGVFFLNVSVYSLDITLRATPSVLIPVESDKYSIGFGGIVQADADILGFLNIGAEGLFNMVKPASLDESINFLGGGLGLSAYYSPFSRLYLGAGGSFGIYNFSTKIDDVSQTAADLYWRGYGELGFRVTPEFTVSATGGYMDYMVNGSDSMFKGINAGLSFRYTFSTNGKSSSSFGISFDQDDSAFPLFMSAYRNCPIGTLVLKNNESSEIRNVRVQFRAGKYTASTYESAKISRINRHSSESIPLYADFSTEILKYSENGKINGEIVVDYELLGKKKQSVQNVIISVYNRNAFYWSDSTALAAFVSSDTPEVQQLASIISGIETNNLIPGMNKNFQIAAAIFEGLRLSGIRYSGDKATPYSTYHTSYELDSIQYPLQTMNYLSGDLDDLGILVMSCLQSVGVPTGYMPLDDDFIVLVGMGISSGTEQNHFTSADNVLSDDDNVYFGLSMANFEKGFVASRKAAAKLIADAKADEENPHEYVSTQAAWQIYSPAVFSGSGSTFEYPSRASVEAATKTAINDYINTDLANVLARARASGDANKIGVALLRSGRVAEAKVEFGKLSTTSAMNNLANCYMVEKNYTAALNQYKRVLAKDPQNRIALNGVEKASEKLGQ